MWNDCQQDNYPFEFKWSGFFYSNIFNLKKMSKNDNHDDQFHSSVSKQHRWFVTSGSPLHLFNGILKHPILSHIKHVCLFQFTFFKVTSTCFRRDIDEVYATGRWSLFHSSDHQCIFLFINTYHGNRIFSSDVQLVFRFLYLKKVFCNVSAVHLAVL